MASPSGSLRDLAGRAARSWLLVVVVGLVIGLAVAPYAYSLTAEPSSTIAVIPVDGAITGSTATAVATTLTEARQDPGIEAVVLVSNSPGGGAAASERLYLEVSRTADQMPVVGSVDAMAASGAYYTVVPSDHIYAKPGSLVGSVGVFALLPQDPQPIDQVIASGSDKLSGGSDRDWAYRVETMRRAFVGAVMESRNGTISITSQELSAASLYSGAEAAQRGMVDEIGGTGAAIRKAAELAGIEEYDVRVMRPDARTYTFVSRTNYVASDATDKELVSPSYLVGSRENPVVPNVLMVPLSVVPAAFDEQAVTGQAVANATNGTREVSP